MPDNESTTPERRVPSRAIAMVIVIVLLVWFALGNSRRVRVDFFFVDRNVRLVYALAIAALLGAVIGWLAARSRYRR